MAEQDQAPGFLSQVGFKLVFNRMPTVAYYTQEAKLPTVSLPHPQVSTPIGVIPYVGDQLKWEVYDITFKVDANLANWNELFTWLTGVGHAVSTDSVKTFAPTGKHKDFVSDATLVILDANKQSLASFVFRDMFPVTLTGLTFTAAAQDIQYLEATGTFAYQRYELTGLTGAGIIC